MLNQGQTSSVQLEPIAAYQLHSMELIRLTSNEAKPRCSVYRQYFQQHLGEVR
ncbi:MULTISPECIES: AAA-like domain-containing protein [Cyanophyceae]|uniref:AAA-like domain-containing protein n=1 Tax=unclassified Leptolyngbya TaxID=2650499 RepID=UPI0018EF8A53|nr:MULTISPECIES: AAA-like domain-containing protein [Cyanophyceae]